MILKNSVSLFDSNQSEIPLRSPFIFEVRTGKLGSEQIKAWVGTSTKSLGLMYCKKRRGPRSKKDRAIVVVPFIFKALNHEKNKK